MSAGLSVKNDRNDLTTGSVFKKLVLFALPLLGSSLIQQLYNTVDIFFAGNFIKDGNAMAAVGASSMIVTLLVCFWEGMSVGCGVVVSQFFGQHNNKVLGKAVHTSVAVGLIGGAGISVLGFFLSPFILVWMQTPQDILDTASSYIQIYFLSVLSLVMYNICSGILRATGDSRSPLIYQCIGGGCNVLGNFIFISVFNMGVMGIAISTLFSQTIPAVCVFVHLCITKKPYRIIIKKIRIDGYTLLLMFKIGIPAGIQTMAMSLSNIIVQSQINILGTDAIGAFTAYYRIELLMYLPIVAFGQAITTFVGQNVGAEQYHRIQKGMRMCLLLGIGVTLAISACVVIWSPQCYQFFGSNAEEVKLGCQIMLLNGSLYFIFNFIEVFSGSLRGYGNSIAPMVIHIVNMCGVRIVALFIMVNIFHNVMSVAVCYPITWVVTSICLIVYYRFSGLYKEIKRHKEKHRELVDKG